MAIFLKNVTAFYLKRHRVLKKRGHVFFYGSSSFKKKRWSFQEAEVHAVRRMKYRRQDVWSYFDKTYEVSAEVRWRERVKGQMQCSLHNICLFHRELMVGERSVSTLT